MRIRSVSFVLLVGAFALAGIWSSPGQSEEPPKSASKKDDDAALKLEKALSKLSKADRALVDAQGYCPAMDSTRLGSMGTPVKITIDGKPVFLCCAGCEEDAKADGKKTLATVEKLKKVTAALAKLPATDLPLAEEQLTCPIQKGSRLGSMGMPVKLMFDGKPVFLCCKGCETAARKDPKATLAKVDQIKKANAKTDDGNK